jgi:hypothetical protein
MQMFWNLTAIGSLHLDAMVIDAAFVSPRGGECCDGCSTVKLNR